MATPDETKADRQCHKCRHLFRDPSTLRRHLNRKRPCAPVVDREELPDDPAEGRCHCRFCGRSYSNLYNVRRHMNSCPIAARGERGMDELYAHVLERTRRAQEREALAEKEVEALRQELRQARLDVETVRRGCEAAGVMNVVYASQNTFVTSITVINIFGREDTGHITTASVREILTQCSASADATGATAATRALLQAALLIYSDPDRPGNLTCYIPNKRDGNALVHGAQGWEIRPVPLILPPMARTSLDLLFDKQPYDGGDIACCKPGLQLLREHEEGLVASGAGLHTVLIRNKDLLSRVLSQLPPAGDSNLQSAPGRHLNLVEEKRHPTITTDNIRR